MFDPEDVSSFDLDLAELPDEENERFEYKGSETDDNALRTKLQKAASGFWNSGGGVFVAGVNDRGVPNGGIEPRVGRKPRKEWIDQALTDVRPQGAWQSVLKDSAEDGELEDGKVVVAVAFQASHLGPHMGPGNRYYVRVGAHTEPAPHFLVEAIRARRGIASPQLAVYLRVSEHQPGFADLVVANLSEEPATDVMVRVSPSPVPLQIRTGGNSREFRVIDRSFPARILFTFLSRAGGRLAWAWSGRRYTVHLSYCDRLQRHYTEDLTLLPVSELPDARMYEGTAESWAATDFRMELEALARGP